MAQLFTNNAFGALASAINGAATTIVLASGNGSKFPSVTGGDYFLATLIGLDSNGVESTWEIVKCTARSTDQLTVIRGQEGTTATSWNAGTRIEIRWTAAGISSKEDVGVAATLDAAHVAALDPHPQYTTTAEASAAAPVQSVAGRTGSVVLTKSDITDLQDALDAKQNSGNYIVTNDFRLTDSRSPIGNAGGVLSGTYPNPGFAVDMATQAELSAHTGDTANPHSVTKAQVGLGSVDNTSDLSKPISTATQAALDGKSSTSHVHSAATTSVAGFMSATDKTKLDGIAAGAQVNVATNLAQGTRTATTVPITSSTGSSATLDVATTSLAGVMSAADKAKVDAAFPVQTTVAASDLNTVGQGVWRVNTGHTNAPAGVEYGTLISFDNFSDTGFQLVSDFTSANFYWRSGNPALYGGSGSFGPWRKVWHDGNVGAGSGLNADLLDGQHGSWYQQALVSGTNIKTVGGTSLLGSGDIPVGTGDVTLTGTQTLTNKTIEAGVFTNGYTEETGTANTSTAYTIDLANGSVQVLTLTGNCTYTFPTPVAGKSFTLIQKQDATGSRTVTWPASVKWPSATAPTITSTASKVDKFVFTAIDGSSWLGSVAGQNYTA